MKRVRRLPQGVRRRALTVIGLILAAAIGARHLAERSGGAFTSSRSPASREAPAENGGGLPRGARSALLAAARAQLDGEADAMAVARGSGERIALVSLSRPEQTALVARGQGATPGDAVAAAVASLVARTSVEERVNGRIKIDLVTHVGPREAFDDEGRIAVDASTEGLWLDEIDVLLLPEELISRRLIDAEGDLHNGRLGRYLAAGGRQLTELPSNPGRAGRPVRRVTFDGFAEGDGGRPIQLYRGNSRSPDLAPERLLAVARAGGEYLLRHQVASGDFDYIYQPQRDEVGDGYNLLRHAGTCYALLELYGATRDEGFLTAARRGIDALLERARGPRPDDNEADFEAIVSPGEEAKLGGAALAVLAIAMHEQVSGDDRWRARAVQLARFIQAQQDPSGRFHSKYFYGAPDPEPFESIYYPGEAILALARLHRLDGNPDWLETARRGADYLIDIRDAGLETDKLPHDHWLTMGLDALHDLTGDGRYPAHAERIATAILGAQRIATERLDWVGTFYDPPRATPTATRAEALVAMHRLALRTGGETRPYLAALMRMAAFQRRCQLRSENALYLPRPNRAIGGFRRSLDTWEIRIDYVQHNLSALLGLRNILTTAMHGDR